jgi:hypothetical protein
MSRALIGRSVGIAASIGLATWLAPSCAAPPPEEDRVDDSIVITKYAPDTDFGEFQTYHLRPEILTVSDSRDGGLEPIDEDAARPLLDLTAKNLESRGYTAVANPAEADIAVQLMYADVLNSTYWCYSWYDYYYWGYPYWGYYPYYGGCTTSVWKSNMLATVIVDQTDAIENPNPGIGAGGAGGAGSGPPFGQLPGVWFSGIYGVSLNSADARDGINQAFKQSPYLRAE